MLFSVGLLFSLFSVFGGCCSSVILLEDFLRETKSCSYLLTFSHFLFISIVSFPAQLKFDSSLTQQNKKPRWLPKLENRSVPMQHWLFMVAFYYLSSLLNNLAYRYHVPVPLNLVFRSSSLVTNMFLGYLIAGKKYSKTQILSVIMVTIGIIVATIDLKKPEPTFNSRTSANSSYNSFTNFRMSQQKYSCNTWTQNFAQITNCFSEWSIGILILLTSVFLASSLGIYQEMVYKKYHGSFSESLFYLHFLALPLFYLSRNEILDQARILTNNFENFQSIFSNNSATSNIFQVCSVDFFINCWRISSNWRGLFLVLFTQVLCTFGVNYLSMKTSSLTLNLILTTRKLASLGLSILLFNRDISYGFINGSIITTLGTLLYISAGRKNKAAPKAIHEKKIKTVKND
ncbi:hypothetical protein BB561_002307 [Smittium simulii]|uniref:Sugar phosphate transporter domain-containing protein n=1 Tax=Smittium simulii TaxID=133385 RepID=A0A2T9YQX8_9FUNG|nr:hypothetical protein BB561_002307 [Smittium simulii]